MSNSEADSGAEAEKGGVMWVIVVQSRKRSDEVDVVLGPFAVLEDAESYARRFLHGRDWWVHALGEPQTDSTLTTDQK